ncbi:MAG: DNA polymerase III subunit alpha, partial [Synergistaceae bacterium]|nr:DNA polymerase III subunit alpha [Synergistaceae bacterium]
SQHAAGVVITPVPTTDIVPIRKIDEGQIVTQYSMEPIEKLGLVKMDFLGLRTLSIIEETINNIKLSEKTPPNIEKIPMDDKKTYELLSQADTLGVFQLESDGMRRMIKRMKIDRFEDLIAALAMYRPGPLGSGMVEQYIKSKNGQMETEYIHPMLKDVLQETYGVILYQEQVMQCATILAGYSLGEADLLRRAMGKKKSEVMKKESPKFIAGCEKNEIKAEEAEEIFKKIEKFADYGFNKSHSAAYALISYQTAWLKANYRTEYMAAYLSSQMGAKKEVIAEYVREVRRSGISVTAPDINYSMANFTAVNDVVRFGLGAVARLGDSAVESILSARKEGPFKSLWDFINRVELNHVSKSVIENLIYAGAFDSLCAPGEGVAEPNRVQLIAALPEFIAAAQSYKSNKGQSSLFGEEDIITESPPLPQVQDHELFERLEKEKEVMGIYISGHPFDQYEHIFRQHTISRINEVNDWRSLTPPKIGGVIAGYGEKMTKKGDIIGIITLEDADNSIEVVCYSKEWGSIKGNIVVGQPYLVEGDLKTDREPPNIIARKITPLEEVESLPPYVRIKIILSFLHETDDVIFKKVGKALCEFPGNSPVLLELCDEEEHTESCVIALSNEKVDLDKLPQFEAALAETLPADSYSITV